MISKLINLWLLECLRGAIKIRKKIEEITRRVRITASVKDSTDYSDFIVPSQSL